MTLPISNSYHEIFVSGETTKFLAMKFLTTKFPPPDNSYVRKRLGAEPNDVLTDVLLFGIAIENGKKTEEFLANPNKNSFSVFIPKLRKRGKELSEKGGSKRVNLVQETTSGLSAQSRVHEENFPPAIMNERQTNCNDVRFRTSITFFTFSQKICGKRCKRIGFLREDVQMQ